MVIIMNNEEYLEKAKERLRFLLYQASYKDYDQNEVDLLLRKIDDIDPDSKNRIENSAVTISLEQLKQKKIVEKSETRKVIAKILVPFAAASIMFGVIAFKDEMIAGRNEGIFHFLSRDSSGVTIMTSPDIITTSYERIEDIPEEVFDILYCPSKIQHYSFTNVSVEEYKGEILQIIQTYSVENKQLVLDYDFEKASPVNMDKKAEENLEINGSYINIYSSQENDTFTYYAVIDTPDYTLTISAPEKDIVVSCAEDFPLYG